MSKYFFGWVLVLALASSSVAYSSGKPAFDGIGIRQIKLVAEATGQDQVKRSFVTVTKIKAAKHHLSLKLSDAAHAQAMRGLFGRNYHVVLHPDEVKIYGSSRDLEILARLIYSNKQVITPDLVRSFLEASQSEGEVKIEAEPVQFAKAPPGVRGDFIWTLSDASTDYFLILSTGSKENAAKVVEMFDGKGASRAEGDTFNGLVYLHAYSGHLDHLFMLVALIGEQGGYISRGMVNGIRSTEDVPKRYRDKALEYLNKFDAVEADRNDPLLQFFWKASRSSRNK